MSTSRSSRGRSTQTRRRGPAIIRDGIPYADPDSTLSLIPAAAIGQWLASNRDAFQGSLLDLGCGQAPFREWYRPWVKRAVAYDPTPGAADVQGIAEQLPFRNESFDCVLCSEVLEHVADDEAALEEIHRVLRPGGELLATVPFLYPVHEAPHDHRRFTHHGLAALVARHGFEVVELTSNGGPAELLEHWALMVLITGSVTVAKPFLKTKLLSDYRWFKALFAAPQRLRIRRDITKPVAGATAWISLGYMVRAKKRPVSKR